MKSFKKKIKISVENINDLKSRVDAINEMIEDVKTFNVSLKSVNL